MSKYIKKTDVITQRWMGLNLLPHQKKILTKITLLEFDKPVKDRRTPNELIKEMRFIYYKTGRY